MQSFASSLQFQRSSHGVREGKNFGKNIRRVHCHGEGFFMKENEIPAMKQRTDYEVSCVHCAANESTIQ